MKPLDLSETDTHGVPWRLTEDMECGAEQDYGYGRTAACQRPVGRAGPHAYDQEDGVVIVWPAALTDVVSS